MPNKCSVGNCRSNYRSLGAPYIPVYSLPSDPEERARWIRALPNVINSEKVFICRKHWPDDCNMVKVKRFLRPRDPPSLFDTPTSYRIQQQPSSRNVKERGVSLESRGAVPDELSIFEMQDLIPEDWSDFILQCSDFASQHQLHFLSNEDECSMAFIDPNLDSLQFSIKVSFVF